MKKEKILGIDVLNIDYQKLIDNIRYDVEKGNKKTIIAINPSKLMQANNDNYLKMILNQADYPIADGVGVLYLSKLNKGNLTKRITGIECMEMLCNMSSKRKFKIFLYGSRQHIVELTKVNLEKKHPGLNIVGAYGGYSNNDETIINKINESKADLLFVALGSPKQEFWIYENKNKLNVKILQGVGGSFDVISGNVKRAPKLMQNIGLEWLYRVIKQPYRLKNVLNFTKFLFIVLFSKNNK